jgi:hypothetical protein
MWRSPVDYKEFYQLYRSQVEAEDALINHRLSWLVGAQAFLLTAFVLLFNNPALYLMVAQTSEFTTAVVNGSKGDPSAIDSAMMLKMVGLLRVVVPVVGLGISVLISLGVWAAIGALQDLIDDFVTRQQKCTNLPAAEARLTPRLVSLKSRRFFGGIPAMFLGPGFIGAWLYILGVAYAWPGFCLHAGWIVPLLFALGVTAHFTNFRGETSIR